MKTFVWLASFFLFFHGCSQNNAFTRFNMTPEQELSADSILKSKVKEGENINGLVSVIYLNSVYPNKYKDAEYFYVYVYLKTNKDKFEFKLNNTAPIKVEKLSRVNKFTNLTSIETKWNKYYLVTFAKQKDKLSFSFYNGRFSSDLLTFEKDE